MVSPTSSSFYANGEVGDLMARFSTDLAPVEQGIDRSLPLAVYSVPGVVVGVPLLLWLDWHLFLVTLVVLPISLLGPRLLGARAATNPLGVKGSGEAGVVGIGAAVANAVADALNGANGLGGAEAAVTRLPLTPATTDVLFQSRYDER